MSINKIYRYAAKLTCIRDYVSGVPMERDETGLSKEACLKAIRELGNIARESGKNSEASLLWDQIGNDYSGVGNKDVIAKEPWRPTDCRKAYEMQAREILAVQAFREKLAPVVTDTDSLFSLADRTGVFCWDLNGWGTFSRRIPWALVTAVEKLQESGSDWTAEEAIRMSNDISEFHKRTYNESRGRETTTFRAEILEGIKGEDDRITVIAESTSLPYVTKKAKSEYYKRIPLDPRGKVCSIVARVMTSTGDCIWASDLVDDLPGDPDDGSFQGPCYSN